jgi:ABC-type nitrate/sulfonate/bicarbonate transport system permease component
MRRRRVRGSRTGPDGDGFQGSIEDDPLEVEASIGQPLFLAGAKSALGLSWKVVVAGELLSQPRFALGTEMQDARLSLDTASVLAWAAATIFLCGISEFLLGIAARRLERARMEPSS